MRGSLSKPLRSNSDGMLDTDASRAYDALGAPVGLDGRSWLALVALVRGMRLVVVLEGTAIFGHHGSSPAATRCYGTAPKFSIGKTLIGARSPRSPRSPGALVGEI